MMHWSLKSGHRAALPALSSVWVVAGVLVLLPAPGFTSNRDAVGMPGAYPPSQDTPVK